MSVLKKLDIFKVATFGIFGFLFFHLSRNMLQIRTDGWYVGQVNLFGDLVFHVGFINKFLQSNEILTSSPFYLDTRPNYPIFADFITAQVARFTNIQFSLFVTTFLAGVLVILVARVFILQFVKNEKVVFLSLLLFFVNGGFGFYYFFQDLVNSQRPLSQFLLSLPREYTDIKENGYWWINTYLAYFIPQRTFLFAFPPTLLALILLYIGIKKRKSRYFALAAIISGILPIIQAHSLFVLFLLTSFFSASTIIFSKNKNFLLKNWAFFAAVTAIISLPLFNTISSTSSAIDFIRIDPGWVSQENIPWFWFKNLGLFGPTLIFATIWLYKKNKNLLILYLPFLMLFILSNIFLFQPWDFDNSKVLIYWFFVSSIVVAYFLYEVLLSKTLPKKIIGIILIIFMTLAGAIDIFKTFTPASKYKVFSSQDLEIANTVKKLTPQNSIFVTAPNHNHPIPALTGRTTLIGFDGWIWSHGLPYTKRNQDVRRVYLGGEEAEETIKNYKINYVTIGPLEKSSFSINENYYKKFPIVSINRNWILYDVSNLWSNSDRQN